MRICVFFASAFILFILVNNVSNDAFQYEMIWDWEISQTSLTTAQTNQWKTYLRDGGVIGMIGENNSWDSKKNAVIEDFLDDIDSAVSSSSSMISGTSYTNGSTGSEAHTIGAAYNVHDNSDGEGTGSAYTVARGSGLAAAGQFHEDYMGDGSLIATNQSDTDAGFIAEWGGDVTDAGYIGTFVVGAGSLEGSIPWCSLVAIITLQYALY